MGQYDKKTKHAVRELLGLAHERELSAELQKLATNFDAWRRGELDAFELDRAIHLHHDGASREVWKRYNPPSHMIDLIVAHAVARRIIEKHEVPDHVLEAMAETIEQYEKVWGDNDGSEKET
jgi:hypothetical protein